MNNKRKLFTEIAVIIGVGSSLLLSTSLYAAKKMTPLEQGKQLTMDFCQACHEFTGGYQAGTVGPPLADMKERFRKRKQLYDMIYDPHVINPDTMMPPFGRNGLVDKKQIEMMIDFLYTL